jgi:hypothetical protein
MVIVPGFHAAGSHAGLFIIMIRTRRYRLNRRLRRCGAPLGVGVRLIFVSTAAPSAPFSQGLEDGGARPRAARTS